MVNSACEINFQILPLLDEKCITNLVTVAAVPVQCASVS